MIPGNKNGHYWQERLPFFSQEIGPRRENTEAIANQG